MAGRFSFNNSFTLLDFIFGRTGRENTRSQQGFVNVVTGGQTNSGEQVNVDTVLNEPTTMSCINIISEGITQLPICVSRITEDGSKEKLKDHPISRLLQRPNSYQTPTDFKSSIIYTLLVHGNCFIRIVRDNGKPQDGLDISGRPIQLVPMDPQDITVGANAFGMPTYDHESFGQIALENVIHIRDISTFTTVGSSRTLLAAEIIGAKIAADSLMSETFKNGININYVINSDEQLSPEEQKIRNDALRESFGNGGTRRGSVLLLGGGATMSSVKGATPADADLRALRQELKNEIAGVFRVPSFMVGGTGADKYNNVRQRLSSFHRDTLQPIIANIEEAFTLKLLNGTTETVEIDVTTFIKGDVDNQSTIAQRLVQAGVWTPNEARAYVGSNPHDSEFADQLIEPNSTSTETVTEVVEPPTGGGDGPQSNENTGGDDAES